VRHSTRPFVATTEAPKVKLFLTNHEDSEGGGRGMECWASILTLTFSTTRAAQLSALAPAALYPQGNSLVLISIGG
jgi:hypothetical protein